MKNGVHLKHLQKKIIRAERNRDKAKAINEAKEAAFERGLLGNQTLYYNEVISSDQQVDRTPRRFMYH